METAARFAGMAAVSVGQEKRIMLIPRQVVKLKNCAARASTRFAINGIQIEREPDGTCIATATDGRCLCTCAWDDESHRPEFPVGDDGFSVDPIDQFSAIVSTDQWTDAFKALPKRSIKDCGSRIAVDETNANGKLTIRTTDGSSARRIEGERIDANFPKWRSIIPDYEVGVDAVEIGVRPCTHGKSAKGHGRRRH